MKGSKGTVYACSILSTTPLCKAPSLHRNRDGIHENMTNAVNENKVATKKIVEIFNTGDLSEVDFLFSSEYVDHQRPASLDVSGSEEFKQIVMGARKSLQNLRVTVEDVIAEDDKVTTRLHWHSTHPTGKNVDRETIDILRFVNGKVVEHWGAEAWTTEHIQNDDAS